MPQQTSSWSKTFTWVFWGLVVIYGLIQVPLPGVFEYKPIDSNLEVRLLRRKRESNNLHFELVTVPAKSLINRYYAALSYTWQLHGQDPRVIHPIEVQGSANTKSETDKRTCWVGKNLFFFLEEYKHRLLGRDTPDYIYIDALCINQNDEVEKANQIRLMQHVYSNAKRTIVWLGKDQAGEKEVGRHWEQLNKFQEYLREGKGTGLEKHTAAVRLICNQRYWERLWIIQECLMSGNTEIWYDGFRRFPWSTIRDCMNTLRIGLPTDPSSTLFERKARHIFDAKEEFDSRSLLRSGAPSGEYGLTMTEALYRFGGQKCLDSKDNVYGLLGLLREHSIVVRYDDDWTILDVLEQVLNQVWAEMSNDTDIKSNKIERFDDFVQFLANECFLVSGMEKLSVFQIAKAVAFPTQDNVKSLKY